MPVKPNRLFLLDGLGACLTVCLLLAIVAPYEAVFGMPRLVVHRLSAVATLLAVYSLGCYWLVGTRWRTYLSGIAMANLLYCCLTFGSMLFYRQHLTGWGIGYFLLGIGIIAGLAATEWKVGRVATPD